MSTHIETTNTSESKIKKLYKLLYQLLCIKGKMPLFYNKLFICL